MALCMLGYRCCSDLETLPTPELERLLEKKDGRVFDAYVNVGSLEPNAKKLLSLYPTAKVIITTTKETVDQDAFESIRRELIGADIAVLHAEEPKKWHVICNHLRCAPPNSSFPKLNDLGQRPILEQESGDVQRGTSKMPIRDKSPWIIETRKWWHGIRAVATDDCKTSSVTPVEISDRMESLDSIRWHLRTDTFSDNLGLFRPSNVVLKAEVGAELFVKSESLGVRDYSAASICSREQFLYGKFEATIRAANVPGVVTGFFLHRNSPRQEIDIEIAGNRPDRLMVNVFYNPGGEGANFDYGYRGAPTSINLGFDASKTSHRFAIEWLPNEIIWRVDGKIVHKRVIWDPTPIPNLPMTLHVNSWPSRSAQLAGRINKRRLPGTAILRSIALSANPVTSYSESDINVMHHTDFGLPHTGEILD